MNGLVCLRLPDQRLVFGRLLLLIKMGVRLCLDQRLVFQRLPGRQAEDCHLATVKIRGGQTEDYRLARMITALKREDYSLRQ